MLYSGQNLRRVARTLSMSAALAIAVGALPGTAQVGVTSAIACPVNAISPKDRIALGASITNDKNAADALTAAQTFIAEAAKPCAKARHWSADQTDNAVAWTEWNLMAGEIQREAGLTDADVTIMRAYVDEDMTRAAQFEHYSSFQRTKMFEELRRRGAHLREGIADDADHEIEVAILVREMRVQEAAFAGS